MSFDYISRLIEISTLSEMDKRNVLSKMVFDNSPKIKQEKIEQEEKILQDLKLLVKLQEDNTNFDTIGL